MSVSRPIIKNPVIPDPMAKLRRQTSPNRLPRGPLPPGKNYGKGFNMGFTCPKCGFPTLIVEKKGDLIKCTHCHTSWSRVE